MTLLGKTMLNLDGAITVLSPRLDPVQLIRNYMLDVMMKRVGDSFSPGRVFAWVLDMKHLFENAPRRSDVILGKLADDRLTVRLDVEHLELTTQPLSRAASLPGGRRVGRQHPDRRRPGAVRADPNRRPEEAPLAAHVAARRAATSTGLSGVAQTISK